ncbi:SMI1/KNR4 family protein [Streptomyces sp. NPDC053728]|uniref:SMI1/KNR4 family protein n=1 Tax=Streptomyces sp. NPDC053728 TaxID=3155534 RepID=UPI0034453302
MERQPIMDLGIENALTSAVEAWARFTQWLSECAPIHADALNPPATEEQIEQAESRMGVRLPLELRQVLMINNGTTARKRTLSGRSSYDVRGGGDYSPFPSHNVFNDVELTCSLYTGNRTASISMEEPGSRYEYWKNGWIPAFTAKEGHSGLFLDCSVGADPAQVYAYGDDSFPDLAFPSLGEYLGAVADALEGIRPFTVMGREAPHPPSVRDGLLAW